MDFTPLYIVIGGLLILAGIYIFVVIGKKNTCKRLDSLGELKGKSYNEIVKCIGEPDSRMPVMAGSFCQWVKFGYHLSLTFDGEGVCTAVDSLKKNA